MSKKNIKLFLILWAALQPLYFFAQQLHFQSYDAAQGLSQNSVYSIAQTNEGFMWFGTQDGLNRFDGKSFLKIKPRLPSDNANKKFRTDFSKQINTLCADDDLLWLGTTTEVIIYNRVKNLFQNPATLFSKFSIPANPWILKIASDNKQNIWILTRQFGLFCYNKQQNKMLNLGWQMQKPVNLIAFNIAANGGVLTASDKEIYISSNGLFFNKLNSKELLKTTNVNITDIKLISNKIWLTTNGAGIMLANWPINKATVFVDFKKEFKGDGYLYDPQLIYQSDSNTVWIGSRSQGLMKINLANHTFINADAVQNKYSLQRKFILSFYATPYGITWVGLSGGGVAKYDATQTLFDLWRVKPQPETSITDNMILSILSTNNQNVYMGTMVGGLLQLNTATNIWQYHFPKTATNISTIKSIYAIAKDSNMLWLASHDGLYKFNIKSKAFTLFVNTADKQTMQLTAVIKLKKQSKLLTGGYEGGLRLFDTKTQKFEPVKDLNNILANHKFRVRYMEEGDEGNVYMGSEAGSFFCYNYLSGLLTQYPQVQRYSGDCRHFCFDKSFLWLATTDGLLQLNATTKQIIKFWTTKDGLPNNYIYAVKTDDKNGVWISTNMGIALIDVTTGFCRKFIEEDGLNALEFNTASVFKTAAGNIWFGGINGSNMVNTSTLLMTSYLPKPLITNIKVMNIAYADTVEAPYINKLVLPYNKNFIGFEFQTPSFSQTDNLVYKYMLTGVDTAWIENGNSNFANYTQLQPGHYVFKVQTANGIGTWAKEITTIDITIVPPWYKTWWFTCLLVTSIIFFTSYFIQLRIKAIKQKAAVQQKITETEMAALKAQMNPHFMFNCINSIDAFIQSNDKYNATLYLNKFAKLIRNVLDSSKHNTVALSKDIETLKMYLELEELRHEQKFITQLHFQQSLLHVDYKVPPLIIQPFVENAILHGLKNKKGNDGVLTIKIEQHTNNIVYTITDNGIGRAAAALIPQNKEASYGMQLSYDRIKLFNKEQQASVVVNDIVNQGIGVGTIVCVTLKIH